MLMAGITFKNNYSEQRLAELDYRIHFETVILTVPFRHILHFMSTYNLLLVYKSKAVFLCEFTQRTARGKMY